MAGSGAAGGAAGRGGDARNWRIINASIGVLLVALGVVGVGGIVANERVQGITERALAFDLEIEDEGDDLRAAVLDLRHYHRNIAFDGASASALADHEEAYNALLMEIGEFEEIGELEAMGVDGVAVPRPAELRRMVEAYRAGFRPAAERADADRAAFAVASEVGLGRIRELERAAERIDALGEELSANSLSRVEAASAVKRGVLFAMLGGVALVGVALGVSTRRVLSHLRASYDREQRVSEELARALRAKTDFIADASHELRTPLTVIRGNADIGLAAPGERTHHEVLREIATESTRMSGLVEDLLFLARSDSGAPPLEREYVPVRWLVRRLAKPAEVLAQQHGACVGLDLEGDGFVEVDPNRVQQAVMILVDNAAKHSPAGACVAVASRVDGGELLVTVADAGPGIPSEELPLIFDRFYQVGKRRARKKGGSGLGLPIAKTIVEAHGGWIGVETGPNRGASFAIRLPLCAPPRSAAESEPEAAGRPAPGLVPAPRR